VETADPGAPAPLDIREADRLYEPFPDFASWKGLTEADLDLWDRFAKGLEAQRAAAPPEAFGRAVEVAMRAAAIDTGAIEGLYDVDRGFTMSVATQAVAWEHAVEEKGADVRALFEAQLEAYELVLDAATKSRPVYEAWVRQLHEVLCRAQATYRVLTPSGWQEHKLVKGQYKTLPNHVRLKDGSFHAYAPVDRVSQEMHRLVEILTSSEFEAAHPVLQASYAHYALVNVHPFADGNGRVARALASLYYYRAVSVPLSIFANQQFTYLCALQASDTESPAPIIGFFCQRGIDAMQLVTESFP
jgi:Fic family protein